MRGEGLGLIRLRVLGLVLGSFKSFRHMPGLRVVGFMGVLMFWVFIGLRGTFGRWAPPHEISQQASVTSSVHGNRDACEYVLSSILTCTHLLEPNPQP